MHRDSAFFTRRQLLTLAHGLDWLLLIEQPDTALVRDGVISPPVDGRRFTFHLNGASREPSISIDVADPRYVGADGTDVTNPLAGARAVRDAGPFTEAEMMGAIRAGVQTRRGALLANPLEPGEVYALAAEVERLGHAVTRVVKGTGEDAYTGAVALETPPHPTLVAAASRYMLGCPERAAQGRCDAQAEALGECPWFADGDAALVRPAWAHADRNEHNGTA